MSARRPHETVPELLIQAQSDSHEPQCKALQTLASLSKVSPQNRYLIAQTNGAIPTLLSLSKSSSPIQDLSLSILFNLSLNSNLKQVLADMEVILQLNHIVLAPSSPESGRLAASLICSLAMLDKNKAKFGVASTVQALVKALQKPPCAASHHLLSSLAELMQFHGNCTLAVRAGVVPVLIQVVESTAGEDLAGTSLAVLGLLARFEEGINAIINREGVVNLMVDVLKGRCMLSKEGSAEILILLFEESEGCLRDAVRMPEFSSLVADLSVRLSHITSQLLFVVTDGVQRRQRSALDFAATAVAVDRLSHRSLFPAVSSLSLPLSFLSLLGLKPSLCFRICQKRKLQRRFATPLFCLRRRFPSILSLSSSLSPTVRSGSVATDGVQKGLLEEVDQALEVPASSD